MLNNVGVNGAKWDKEIADLALYLEIPAEDLTEELAPLIERVYKRGAQDMYEDVEHAFNNNEPKPGWWSRVKVLMRVKYDL